MLLTDGPMVESEAVGTMMAVLDGLSAVHAAKLVHRDMKPDNIILHSPMTAAAASRRPIPKIVDFGMAKGLRGVDGSAMAPTIMMTEHDMIAGTPEYMSPEQWEGIERNIDASSDIWAVGATLFQLLSGKTPFEPHRGQPRRNIIGQVRNA